jgi:hypothetical protein
MNIENKIFSACKMLDLEVSKYGERDLWIVPLDGYSLALSAEEENEIQLYCAMTSNLGIAYLDPIYLFISMHNQRVNNYHLEIDPKYNVIRSVATVSHNELSDSLSVEMIRNSIVSCVNGIIEASEYISKVAEGKCHPAQAINELHSDT